MMGVVSVWGGGGCGGGVINDGQNLTWRFLLGYYIVGFYNVQCSMDKLLMRFQMVINDCVRRYWFKATE